MRTAYAHDDVYDQREALQQLCSYEGYQRVNSPNRLYGLLWVNAFAGHTNHI